MCGTVIFLKEFLHFVELQQPLNTEDMSSVCWDWCISSFHTLQTQDWLLLYLQKCFCSCPSCLKVLRVDTKGSSILIAVYGVRTPFDKPVEKFGMLNNRFLSRVFSNLFNVLRPLTIKVNSVLHRVF